MSNRAPVVKYGDCKASPVKLVSEGSVAPEGLVDESLSVIEQNGAGFSFELGDNVGNHPSVVKYTNCSEQKQIDIPKAEEVPEGVGNDNLSPVQGGGKKNKSKRRRRRRRKNNKKVNKTKQGGSRKSKSKKRTKRKYNRKLRQRGGDLNCPTCNMSTRDFGCSQPNWKPECI
jgi:hypothetical protein